MGLINIRIDDDITCIQTTGVANFMNLLLEATKCEKLSNGILKGEVLSQTQFPGSISKKKSPLIYV